MIQGYLDIIYGLTLLAVIAVGTVMAARHATTILIIMCIFGAYFAVTGDSDVEQAIIWR